MTNLQRKIATAIATGALLLNTVTPAFAAKTLIISNNGADSESTIEVDVDRNVDVEQDNDADINNTFNITTDTGDNDATDNNGGDVEVETGDSLVTVKANNVANTNHAAVDCCPGGDLTAKVSDNAADSDNDIDVDYESDIDIDQDNDADIDNDVDVDQDSGNNDASDNNGGSVKIETGKTIAVIDVSNAANWNKAVVGGGNGNGVGAEVSAEIVNNAADSDNDIDLDFDNDVDFDQENDADFDNDVDVDQDTGDNDAEDNNGGEVKVETGAAKAVIMLDNLANFNWANTECDCLFEDLLAKISKNAADSENTIEAEFDDELDVDQDNDSDFDNDVDVDSETGDNDVDGNNAGGDEDPSVKTGKTEVGVDASNSGNANVFGPSADMEMPEVNLSFDFSDLLKMLTALGLVN